MNGFDYLRSLTIEQLALFLHNAEAMAVDMGAQSVESWIHWLRFGDEDELCSRGII